MIYFVRGVYWYCPTCFEQRSITEKCLFFFFSRVCQVSFGPLTPSLPGCIMFISFLCSTVVEVRSRMDVRSSEKTADYCIMSHAASTKHLTSWGTPPDMDSFNLAASGSSTEGGSCHQPPSGLWPPNWTTVNVITIFCTLKTGLLHYLFCILIIFIVFFHLPLPFYY